MGRVAPRRGLRQHHRPSTCRRPPTTARCCSRERRSGLLIPSIDCPSSDIPLLRLVSSCDGPFQAVVKKSGEIVNPQRDGGIEAFDRPRRQRASHNRPHRTCITQGGETRQALCKCYLNDNFEMSLQCAAKGRGEAPKLPLAKRSPMQGPPPIAVVGDYFVPSFVRWVWAHWRLVMDRGPIRRNTI